MLKNLGVEEVARRTGRGEEEVCGLEHRILDLREAEEEAEDDKRAASKKVGVGWGCGQGGMVGVERGLWRGGWTS